MLQGSFVLEKSSVPIRKANITSSMISARRQKVKTRIKSLAEAVILQSIEDLFDSLQREKSIDFFKGENFTLCAETAGLSTLKQMRIIMMLSHPDFKQYPFEK